MKRPKGHAIKETTPAVGFISEDEDDDGPFAVGRSYFFRTVTYHCVGRVVECYDNGFLRLAEASWIADSGRFMQAIKNGTLSEVEPIGDMVVNRDTIVDAFPWSHPLPTAQK